MKLLLVISLLSSLILPFAGPYSFLSLQVKLAKKEATAKMQAGIPKESLTHLKFSHEGSTQLEWEHSREFEYNGTMYDVVSVNQLQDSVIYLCYPDIKESKFKKQKIALLKQLLHKDQSDPKQQMVLHFFKSIFFNAADTISFTCNHTSHKVASEYSFSPQTCVLQQICPPPEDAA